MKLDDIDINKIDEAITVEELEIAKARPHQDRLKELVKLKETVEWYIGIRNTQRVKGLATAQGQEFMEIMDYAPLAIHLGRAGIQTWQAIHQRNPGSFHKASQDRLEANKNGWVAETKAFVQKLLKKSVYRPVKDKVPARTAEVSEQEEIHV